METLIIRNVELVYKLPKAQALHIRKRKRRAESDSDDDDQEKESPSKKRSVQYEVETIIDRCVFPSGSVFYLVKWKYWNSKYNTWEPAEHLDCAARVKEYVRSLEGERYPSKCIDEYLHLMVQPTKENLENFMHCLLKERRPKKYTVKSELDIKKLATTFLKYPEKRTSTLLEKLKRNLLLKYFYVRRVRQLTALREWKEEMSLSTNDGLPLDVENDVDLEGPPDNFFYVNEYIPGPGVLIPDDPPVGCKCKTCDARSRCCSKLAKVTYSFAYSHKGLLSVPADTPIYECNKRCGCGPSCRNRVVQKGRRVKLSIFRTTTRCGWGVKALQDIDKGSFVCCYVGEVVTNEEAESRMDRYQDNTHAYLFDMDYNGANHKYTVDGTIYGNVSRFINHSCKPNLTVCFVWIDCLDPSLPLLAFFTTQVIRAGEELTIDYIGDSIKVDTSIKRSKPCRCGHSECKKFIL
ncbi:hypothetical protein R5R35_004285 [Gryllus longicercus]|uniref:Histone-lysine N-methyltransferase n=1 Tax=Gryllus longicercus TaxID=2509291 RepID=A0AAN9W1P2_9ORTH